MRNAVHDQLELALNHADNLLVRMLMFGKPRARIDGDPGMRDAIAVNEARPKTRKNLTDRQAIDVNERHRPTLHQHYLE